MCASGESLLESIRGERFDAAAEGRLAFKAAADRRL